MQLLVEEAESIHHPAAEEDRRLAQKRALLEPLGVPRAGVVTTDDVVGGVDEVGVTVEHIDVRMRGKVPGDGRERSGGVDVVRVQPADDVAGCCPNAFVDRLRLTGIRLADDAQALAIGLEDAAGRVRARSVAHDVVEIGVVLVEHTPQRALDEAALIERGGDDRDPQHRVLDGGGCPVSGRDGLLRSRRAGTRELRRDLLLDPA